MIAWELVIRLLVFVVYPGILTWWSLKYSKPWPFLWFLGLFLADHDIVKGTLVVSYTVWAVYLWADNRKIDEQKAKSQVSESMTHIQAVKQKQPKL